MTLVLKNFLAGQLSSGITATQFSITNDDFDILPPVAAPDELILVFDPLASSPNAPELVTVISHAAGSDTVTLKNDGTNRLAAQGTTSRSHATAIPWKAPFTAGHYDYLQTKGPRDTLWLPPTSPSAFNDEFNDETLDPAWTRIDVGASAVVYTEKNDVLSVYVPPGDASGALHGLVKPMTGLSPPVTVEVATRWFTPYAYNYLMAGPVFTDSLTVAGSKQVYTETYTNSGLATAVSAVMSTAAAWNHSTSPFSAGNWQNIGGPIYQRLVWVSANTWRLDLSGDGVSWILGTNTAFTMTPTHFGVMCSGWGGGTRVIASHEYFRVY